MANVDFFPKFLNLLPKEEFLLKLYVKEAVTDKEVYHLLYDFNYDIEKEDIEFNFLLADLLKNNPNIEIPKNIKPRLNGIINFFQYKNVQLLSCLKQLALELNIKNIPIMLADISTMRVLDKNKIRMMFDIDCAVPKENFNETIKIIKNLGFQIKRKYFKGIEITKEKNKTINVYNAIVKNDNNWDELYKQIFKRAKQYSFYGTNVFIANNEDIIFLLFNNGFWNIIKSNTNINWDIIIENAKKTKTLSQLKIMLELFDCFLPNIIPNEIISSIKVLKNEEKKINLDIKINSLYAKILQLKKEYKCQKVRKFFILTILVIKVISLKIIQKVINCTGIGC